MSLFLQIAVILLCGAFFIFVIKLIANNRLLLKYSLLWLALALVVTVLAVIPDCIFILAKTLGFETPSNFIFFVAIFFLLSICLSLSSIASKQSNYIKHLTQEQALLEKKFDDCFLNQKKND